MEWKKDTYILSDDKALIDLDFVRLMLSTSFWASGRDKDTIIRSIENSLCFGLFEKSHSQIGFVRFITDRAVYSWLCDFIISEDHRGKGLGKWMMEKMLSHPEIKGTRVGVRTKNAQEFYRRYGFENDDVFMIQKGNT